MPSCSTPPTRYRSLALWVARIGCTAEERPSPETCDFTDWIVAATPTFSPIDGGKCRANSTLQPVTKMVCHRIVLKTTIDSRIGKNVKKKPPWRAGNHGWPRPERWGADTTRREVGKPPSYSTTPKHIAAGNSCISTPSQIAQIAGCLWPAKSKNRNFLAHRREEQVEHGNCRRS